MQLVFYVSMFVKILFTTWRKNEDLLKQKPAWISNVSIFFGETLRRDR